MTPLRKEDKKALLMFFVILILSMVIGTVAVFVSNPTEVNNGNPKAAAERTETSPTDRTGP